MLKRLIFKQKQNEKNREIVKLKDFIFPINNNISYE